MFTNNVPSTIWLVPSPSRKAEKWSGVLSHEANQYLTFGICDSSTHADCYMVWFINAKKATKSLLGMVYKCEEGHKVSLGIAKSKLRDLFLYL